MDWFSDPNAWAALLTLTVLEIVLGIDNIIFISILAGRLPAAQQARARLIGLAVAMVSRIALLFSITWVMRLTEPLFTVVGQEISGRDLILIGGGLFLLAKATHNAVMMMLMAALMDVMRDFAHAVGGERTDLTIKARRRFLEALHRRDATAAVAEMTEHLESLQSRYRARMRDRRGGGT